ncbi:ankyrin repeat-containing domain protein [Desarmillaria tabescens]|uniref:Ankyrin repeat-containing domain protein n=1 Tax=Armillaria tabescens TaxID=1929756 RepID=A0AA39J486_ARMTA|nr:ankyrin repeat-containing domain protein [Desarmillaria tabescens]KAK0434053.1 ankyrin repeat-containing domain protein [Desarmillaria tabescens]
MHSSSSASFILLIQSMNPWSTESLDTVIQNFKAATKKLHYNVSFERQVREHNEREKIKEDREEDRRKDEQKLIAKLEHTKKRFLKTMPHIKYQDKHECYRAILSSGRPAPGQWLLRNQSYQFWRKCPTGTIDPALHLLWVSGKLGIGKTVLASVIINDLKSMESVETNIAVAYFYCERDQPSKINPLNILGTILYQLTSFLSANSQTMKTLYDEHILPATVSDLAVLLNIVLEGPGQRYIVIDALDECPDVALQQLLPVLVSLSRKALILVTTRPIAPLIEPAFQGSLRSTKVTVTDRDVNPDIKQYIQQCIVTAGQDQARHHIQNFGPVIKIKDLSLREEIIKTLTDNAEGMFLWVRLQVQHLSEQRTDHDIRTSLQELPGSLAATYIRSLDYIYHLDKKRQKRVQGIFQWLICASSPLNTELVRHAIAVDEMSDYWDPSMVVTSCNDLISDCAHLVEFTATPQSKDKDSKTMSTIQFVHTSVKDFLVNLSTKNSAPHLSLFAFRSLPSAHHTVFQSCFKHLSMLEKRAEGPDPCPELSEYIRGPNCLLHMYNADNGDNRELETLTRSFLAMLSMRTSPIPSVSHDNDKADIRGPTALHIAAGLYCSNVMGHLLTSSFGFSLTECDKFGRTPLHYAAGRLFKRLRVADNGYSCIRLLLEAKADVNAVDKDGRTALHYIAQLGVGHRFMQDRLHPESPIQLLLQKGANPNICDVQGETALHCASRCKWVDKHILQVLLANHGDPNIPNKNGETCLHVLMMNEMPDNDALKTLLDGGAKPDARDANGKTPLHILVEQSRFFRNLVQTVKVLLECPAGLDVNACDKEGMTPLHILARDKGPLYIRRRYPKGAASVANDILKLLLRHGADVSAQDLKGSTPYQIIEVIVKKDRIAAVVSSQDMSEQASIQAWASLPPSWEETEQSEPIYPFRSIPVGV